MLEAPPSGNDGPKQPLYLHTVQSKRQQNASPHLTREGFIKKRIKWRKKYAGEKKNYDALIEYSEVALTAVCCFKGCEK